MSKERSRFPDWANRERKGDLRWINENFDIFWSAAYETYKKTDRGAIVVDTTTRPTGEGHPFGYLTIDQLEELDDKDVMRMVKKYDLEKEIVIVLLKSNERISTYQIMPQKKPDQS